MPVELDAMVLDFTDSGTTCGDLLRTKCGRRSRETNAHKRDRMEQLAIQARLDTQERMGPNSGYPRAAKARLTDFEHSRFSLARGVFG